MATNIDINKVYDILLINKINNDSVNPELVKATTKPTEFFVENFIAKNSINYLGGYTGAGKSILCFQLANALVNNQSFLNWRTNFNGIVVLLDFELNDDVFISRHKQVYNNPQLIRIGKKAPLDKMFFRLEDERLMTTLKELGQNRKAIGGDLFLIIDNITYAGIDIHKNNEALKFIDMLHSLQKDFGYTILVVGHLSKSLPKNEALDLRHVLGSTTLIGAFSTIAGLRKSVKDTQIRALKILKNSLGEEEQVFELQLSTDTGNIHFNYQGETTEAEHLEQIKTSKDNVKTERWRDALSLINGNGISYTKLLERIKNQFRTANSTAKYWINKMINSGEVINIDGLYYKRDT
jgi:RecA-family ATPase